MAEGKNPDSKKKLVSRRDFLVGSGAVIAAGALTACTPKTITNTVTETTTKTSTTTSVPPPVTQTATATTTATATVTTTATTTKNVETKAVYAESKGYITYDSMKCCGCMSCMGACSLAHEGAVNLSLARIQIIQNSFYKFPVDIKMAPCRQCATPVCVQNCPVGAAYIDTANGNIRRIDQTKCTGCKVCLAACPQQPNRTIWDATKKKATKCDLCIDTAAYWNEKGGPTGKQACVEICPMHALKFSATMPDQTETDGYDVNLRTANWLVMGLVSSNLTFYVTSTLNPTAGGRVSGTVTAPAGMDAVITISANAGYTIKDVVIDGKSVGAVTTYTFAKINSNHTVAVTYDAPTTTTAAK